MKFSKIIYCLLLLLVIFIKSYAAVVELDSDYCDWYFSIGKNKKQYMAIVPGSNINDLVCNQLIPNPYIDNNISNIKWIEDSSFTYVTAFDLQVRAEFKYDIIFEGLDTYAEVYLNNQLVLKSNNMFVAYQDEITPLLRDGTNLLKIVFKSAVEVGKQKAIRNAIKYPADNEEGDIKASPFVRKAAFQFGWDINPRLVSCGIWRPIKIISNLKKEIVVDKKNEIKPVVKPFYKLRQEKEADGVSFAFYSNDKKPVQTFMYGANYVPYNMYPLPIKNYKRVAHLQKNQGLPNRNEYYRQLFSELKNYGCNMLRVWGGGWYEDDYFYELADSMQIAIWQDFMFANTMYPGDEEWINTVKEEITYNVERLSKHPCIALWSGNNEIEVAWENWGWQAKYNYSKNDSLKLIHDYRLLFDTIIPNELKIQNSKVKYIPSSPISNWGRTEDFKKGDNHYWGIWHGEAPLEDFYTHVPRFASEYGMPSLGVNSSLNFYNTTQENAQFPSQWIEPRLKSYKGMRLLNRYINDYLPVPASDSALSYASRYIQFKALKTAYNAHLYNFPVCSGSLFWQFNESWPGITWAAIDFSGQRKIPPYQADYTLVVDSNATFHLKSNPSKINTGKIDLVQITAKDMDGKIAKNISKKTSIKELHKGIEINLKSLLDSLNSKEHYFKLELVNIQKHKNKILWDTLLFIQKEKEVSLKKPTIQLVKIDEHHIKITSNTLVLGLLLACKGSQKLNFNQNFINIEAGEEQIIAVEHDETELDLSSISFYSIYDLQVKKR
jgi:beta-mannosidase